MVLCEELRKVLERTAIFVILHVPSKNTVQPKEVTLSHWTVAA